MRAVSPVGTFLYYQVLCSTLDKQQLSGGFLLPFCVVCLQGGWQPHAYVCLGWLDPSENGGQQAQWYCRSVGLVRLLANGSVDTVGV